MRSLYLPLLALAVAASSAHAATFTVDTTSDDNLAACTAAAGDCSLRGAITNANALSDSDTIAFDIPAASDAGCVVATGVCRITLTADLPMIGGTTAGFALSIDGYTQSGAQPNTVPAPGGLDSVLKIELRPSAPNTPANGLVQRSPTTVRGLAIGGFATGIGFFAGSPCSADASIHGNYINTDASGTLSVAQSSGIGIRASLGSCGGGAVQIGSAVPADRNLLVASPSGGKAVLVDLGTASVEGNLIGSDRSGTVVLGAVTGIQVFRVFNAQHVTIGGPTPEQGNVIVGASNIGLDLGGSCATVEPCVAVENNRIGVGSTGAALGNSTAVILTATGHIRFGGPGVGNWVANNKRGVVITNGSRHDIAENRFANNVGDIASSEFGLGISLAGITHLANDVGDADAGRNHQQNFPEITAFAINNNNVELDYRVDSATANSVYPLRVDFYKAAGDEGQDFLGSDTYLDSESQLFKSVSLPIPAGITLDANDVIVATATDAEGNTSEFSFHTATLAIIETQVVTCADLADDALFCNGFEPGETRNLLVRVSATAMTGPFAPNGVVRVSRSSVHCELTLVPLGGPLISEGECVLPGLGNPGTLTVTAKLSAVRAAFGTETGDHVSVSEVVVIPADEGP